MGRTACLEAVEQKHLKKDIPSFRVGDTLKVNIRIVEERAAKSGFKALAAPVSPGRALGPPRRSPCIALPTAKAWSG